MNWAIRSPSGAVYLHEDAASYGVSRGAHKRTAYPDAMAGAARFLASPASDCITGQNLIVDRFLLS